MRMGRSRRAMLRGAVAAGMVTVISACGQKGPLYWADDLADDLADDENEKKKNQSRLGPARLTRRA